ncbi:hypothetical protein HY798_04350 [Candidatus Falkowbacteria bacterium]|nr:hypothetical protein [Candidatus Falkowbacteria bacterium]
MPTPKQTSSTPPAGDVEANKVVAALSYVWILCLVPLLGKKNSEFAQFHAKQGFILFLISFLSWFPILGWLIGLVLIVVSVMGIIKALNGEKWEIPYVYNWSKKINL